MTASIRNGILVAGSANLDFVVRAAHVPAPGETVLGRDFATFPGGKGSEPGRRLRARGRGADANATRARQRRVRRAARTLAARRRGEPAYRARRSAGERHRVYLSCRRCGKCNHGHAGGEQHATRRRPAGARHDQPFVAAAGNAARHCQRVRASRARRRRQGRIECRACTRIAGRRYSMHSMC